ncbi:unnamed protein product [Aphis gossypii]|uniref:Uncharacterized protein n=1 Tax=Aphis gossypii TaxID=80765 RepID=A0A9P0NR68_APHGO|nr:unnamed protein product [Aphis gossypii]
MRCTRTANDRAHRSPVTRQYCFCALFVENENNRIRRAPRRNSDGYFAYEISFCAGISFLSVLERIREIIILYVYYTSIVNSNLFGLDVRQCLRTRYHVITTFYILSVRAITTVGGNAMLPSSRPTEHVYLLSQVY